MYKSSSKNQVARSRRFAMGIGAAERRRSYKVALVVTKATNSKLFTKEEVEEQRKEAKTIDRQLALREKKIQKNGKRRKRRIVSDEYKKKAAADANCEWDEEKSKKLSENTKELPRKKKRIQKRRGYKRF